MAPRNPRITRSTCMKSCEKAFPSCVSFDIHCTAFLAASSPCPSTLPLHQRAHAHCLRISFSSPHIKVLIVPTPPFWRSNQPRVKAKRKRVLESCSCVEFEAKATENMCKTMELVSARKRTHSELVGAATACGESPCATTDGAANGLFTRLS
jgi:hypothetical protein